MTALKARSLPRSRCGFGYAFLEVCRHSAKPSFSLLRHSCLNSFAVPSVMISRSSARIPSSVGLFGKNRHSKPIDSCGIPHAAPAASFLRLYPKRPARASSCCSAFVRRAASDRDLASLGNVRHTASPHQRPSFRYIDRSPSRPDIDLKSGDSLAITTATGDGQTRNELMGGLSQLS